MGCSRRMLGGFDQKLCCYFSHPDNWLTDSGQRGIHEQQGLQIVESSQGKITENLVVAGKGKKTDTSGIPEPVSRCTVLDRGQAIICRVPGRATVGSLDFPWTCWQSVVKWRRFRWRDSAFTYFAHRTETCACTQCLRKRMKRVPCFHFRA